ncbi:DAK2 domain-containing protein [Longimycelium tulufanense]|uniref:DAK2 domain-containing protein n=1 Tax=Longimycelium tulufanense TaxID=907463 RepID=UPI003570C740
MQVLDAAAVCRWAAACVAALDTHREDVDRINVYPVPDGDTGTNLLHTMRSALDALLRVAATPDQEAAAEENAASDQGAPSHPDPGLDAEPSPAREAAPGVGVDRATAALARGALAGARGNSGMILCQVLRGFGEAFQGTREADGPTLCAGLHRADQLAVAAVTEPAPGTILSVLHAAATSARECGSDSLDAVVGAAAKAAAEALAQTPHQLPALARAGVVDAGGRGLVILLDALLGVVTGHQEATVPPVHRVPRPGAALRAAREGGDPEHEYEVMYLLDGTDDARATRLRAELAGLGDCVSVVADGTPGGTGLWSVHVHCTDVGAAIEAGIEAGRPHRVTVIRFADQIATEPTRFPRERAVVAIVDGSGLAELFRGEGAVVVTGRPSAADLLAAISGSRAAHVAVLPNAADLTEVAEQAANQAVQSGQDVVVVPTASPVQGLAAVAVHDPARRSSDDVVAMAEAAAATRRGELLVAQREALTWVGRCQAGDVLGLADGEVVLIADDVVAAACQLADRMLSVGGELVTALLGRHAPAGLGQALEEHLRESHPEVELTVYSGGQRDVLLRLGVE